MGAGGTQTAVRNPGRRVGKVLLLYFVNTVEAHITVRHSRCIVKLVTGELAKVVREEILGFRQDVVTPCVPNITAGWIDDFVY